MKKIVFEVGALVLVIVLFSAIMIKYYGDADILDPQSHLNIGNLKIDGHNVEEFRNTEEIKAEFEEFMAGDTIKESQGNAESVSILVYHGLTPEANGEDSTIKEFKEHMFMLKKEGYETITLDQLYAFMRGETQLPEKSMMITFDDGRKDSYYFSDSILEAMNYSAVMFAVAKYSVEDDHQYYLNIDELREMNNTGRWEIQSHSYTGHSRIQISPTGETSSFFGNKLWLKEEQRLETDTEYVHRITEDLLTSNIMLEEAMGYEIDSFAIPFSDFGQYETNFDEAADINRRIYEKLFRMVFYQFKPIKNKDFRSNYHDEESDFYFIMRNTVYPDTSGEDIIELMEASSVVSLPYMEDYANKQKWIVNWGNAELKEDSLEIKNNVGNISSTLTYLDGSYPLEDYEYTVRIRETNNHAISLIVRFQNVNNYAHCIYSPEYIGFETIADNKRVNSERISLSSHISSDTELGVRVEGDQIECLLDGKTLFRTTSLGMPEHGGVGLRAWAVDSSSSSYTIFDTIEIKER